MKKPVERGVYFSHTISAKHKIISMQYIKKTIIFANFLSAVVRAVTRRNHLSVVVEIQVEMNKRLPNRRQKDKIHEALKD